MAIVFHKKKLVGVNTLGERLRAVREESGLNLERIAQETGIQRGYLEAIEASKYDQLPSEVYARNFVKKYAKHLELNPDSVLLIFDKERLLLKRSGRPTTQPMRLLLKSPGRHLVITPKLIRNALVGLVLLACFSYLGYVVYKSTAPPTLVITEPANNLITHERSLVVAGHAESGSKITINGQLATTSQDGDFRETVNLQEGMNIIVIEAMKNRGRPTIIYRQILVNNI